MKQFFNIILIGFVLTFFATHSIASPTTPMKHSVKIIAFSSVHCPFCSTVEQNTLRPLEKKWGDSLQVLRVETIDASGRMLMENTWLKYNIKAARQGVPTVVVGTRVLVGTEEISNNLNKVISDYTIKGGAESWPAILGLEEYLEHNPGIKVSFIESVINRFMLDMPGNLFATLLLLILLVLFFMNLKLTTWQRRLVHWVPFWLKVLTAFIGLCVALYLSYGETSQQELFCGPIGQCNIVQQSSMAYLFGFLPLGLLGSFGYLIILFLYFALHYCAGSQSQLISKLLLISTGFGFLFSILLTFWQPFIIGATCMWCLISAITMTLSFLFNRTALSQ